jgi:Xaa-Pro aminopeptidase
MDKDIMEEKMATRHDFSINVLRRKDLATAVKSAYPTLAGNIILFAGFESGTTAFRQESSFYYLSGLREPGLVMVLDAQGNTDLYIPNCDQERAKWSVSPVALTQKNAKNIGMAHVHYLGAQCVGYQFHPFFPETEYATLITLLKEMVSSGKTLFTLAPETPYAYIEQRLILERLKKFIPGIEKHIVDISPLVADMRRKKDMSEIERMYKAAEITTLGQEAAAQAVGDGMQECEVQAGLEYMFTGSGARNAFASIVASGKNSTVLHYHDNNGIMRNGDLVVVDIGAEYEYYCADITRTYPVSGTFTPRQRQIYDLVLATQEYIASVAKPGMWLSNKEHPEQSLNHLAKKYLEERGYGKYFVHGIGHFLGLDVHDVGDHTKPLQEGDVITIEPGIYIPEERIGIRIEDDYWIVKDGVVCLSENLPKTADEIEAMMQEMIEPENALEDDEDDFDDEDDNVQMDD